MSSDASGQHSWSTSRYMPPLVFAVTLAIGLAMTLVLYGAEKEATNNRFEVVANDAADRVREAVNEHIAFLRSAHAFFMAHGLPTGRLSFARFVDDLDLTDSFSGIQGIGYAPRVSTGEEADIAARISDNYSIDRPIEPEATDQRVRTPILLLEPFNVRNSAALGMDMYAEPRRRAAMIGADIVDGPFASAPVILEQEITSEKQTGFLVYIPVDDPTSDESPETSGYVYAPFRAGDLHQAAFRRMPPLPVVVQTADVTESTKMELYTSPDYDAFVNSSDFSLTRGFEIAGRKWEMHILARPEFGNMLPSIGIVTTAVISLLLALALAISARAQHLAVEAARQLQANTESSLHEKDMMLQEMNHRIKNSIARVLAIARQTTAHSTSLEEFSASYTARLQAMAGAQDMLTRSHWQRADLRELLVKELEQVFGSDIELCTVSGEDFELNERATQALGLVFHELATNALKYGGMSEQGGRLAVDWQVTNDNRSSHLVLDWRENSTSAARPTGHEGFGTRLINANIKGELGGTIDRNLTSSGLWVHMRIPMQKAKA